MHSIYFYFQIVLKQGIYMKFLSKIALATITVSMASFASAASISGSTDFRITLPEILVLYHWDDAHLVLEDLANITATNDSDPREISDNRDHKLTAPIGGINYEITQNSVDINKYKELSTDIIAVTLENSWAVRSLSIAPVTLALTNPNATLKNVTENTSTIITKDAFLASGGTGVANSGTATITIPSGWAPVSGDIKFNLSLANANHSGEYNTRGDIVPATTANEGTDTFLLTLTGTAP